MISVVGLKEAEGFLDTLRAGLAQLTPFFDSLAVYIEDTVKQRVLKTGQGPDGPWSPPYNAYSASWARFRAAHGRNIDHVYLNFTGGMFSSMTHETAPNLLRVFFMPTPSNPIRTGGGKVKKSTVTNAEKAYYLDQKRPFFGLNARDADFVAKRFEAYVQNLIDSTRGR